MRLGIPACAGLRRCFRSLPVAVILLAIGFSEKAFIIWRNLPSVPKLLKVFNQRMLSFVSCLSYISCDYHTALFFILLFGDSYNLYVLNQPCIPGIKSHLSNIITKEIL